MKLQIGANIAHRVTVDHRIRDGIVDRLHPVDQRKVGPRQGAARKLHLDQGTQGGQLLDPFVAQLRRRYPARGRHGQRPFRRQPPHGLAGGGHRHLVFLPDSPQCQRLSRGQIAVHDAGPQLPIDTVMGQRMRIKGARVQIHIAVVITNRRCVNGATRARPMPA